MLLFIDASYFSASFLFLISYANNTCARVRGFGWTAVKCISMSGFTKQAFTMRINMTKVQITMPATANAKLVVEHAALILLALVLLPQELDYHH